MLVKLCLRNIQNSLRDYAVYFLTLVIGVSVFYVFNAVGDQATMMQATENGGNTVRRLTEALAAISVLVAIILGLLIVYANRFLMKRRNKEFALYMLLGMRKRAISSILMMETLLVGAGSLGIGLVVGVGISQLMSTLVANLFEADMSAYRFSLSGGSVAKTVVNFAVMFVVVMLLNNRSVTRMKLIDLMQSGRKSEVVKLKNPVVCVVVFVIALALLGLSYFVVAWNPFTVTGPALSAYILVGSFATFLVFWSTSGMILRIAQRLRSVYFSSLNSFTFRQISSKVNTVVFSMTIICLLLFFTICMLASAFTLRGGMNANLANRFPADFELRHVEIMPEDGALPAYDDVVERYAAYGYDLTSGLRDYVHFHSYADPSLRLFTVEGDGSAGGGEVRNPSAAWSSEGFDEIVRLSDYNRLMELYGRDAIELGEDEYAFVCDFARVKAPYDELLKSGLRVEVFGHTLASRYPESQEGSIDLGATFANTGLYVVPDAVVDESGAVIDYVMGHYNAQDDAQLRETDKRFHAERNEVEQRIDGTEVAGAARSYYLRLTTKIEVADEAVSSGALMTFVCLYLGLVFLVACGAILALQGLSESVDSVPRYEILRKIGADECDIDRSLFYQTSIFFLMPLVLACIHSVFGMKFMMEFMSAIGMQGMLAPVLLTVLIILLVYGGYFVATYLGSKRIIHGR